MVPRKKFLYLPEAVRWEDGKAGVDGLGQVEEFLPWNHGTASFGANQ